MKFLKNLLSKDNSAIEKVLERGALIIDVRSQAEFSEGHIEGSKNIPLIEIKHKVKQIKEWNKPVITVCLSGNRSAVAKSVLAAEGIEVYNGGSWSELKSIIA